MLGFESFVSSQALSRELSNTSDFVQQEMRSFMFSKSLRGTLFGCLSFFVVAGGMAKAQQWTVPTPEELSMTSIPQVPGASAVYLFREEKTEDHLHMYSVYERIKILAEGGKERANVELKYQSGGSMGYSVSDIAGRTIHPDGTVISLYRKALRTHGDEGTRIQGEGKGVHATRRDGGQHH